MTATAQDEQYSRWEQVTPSMAAEDLVTADCGRPVSNAVVFRYTRDMKSDNWKSTPEGIIYRRGDGVMIDGQQRYMAIVRAAQELKDEGKLSRTNDFSVRLWVTRNADPEGFPFLNIGKNRTAGDLLSMMGHGNATTLGAIGRRIAMWDAGKPTGATFRPTRAEVLEVLRTHPRAVEASQYAKDWDSRDMSPSTAGFLWWLFTQIHYETGNEFMEQVRTGSGVTDKDPAWRLRKRLADDKFGAARHGHQVKPNTVIWLTIRAWNARRRGEELTKLQMPTKISDQDFIRPR